MNAYNVREGRKNKKRTQEKCRGSTECISADVDWQTLQEGWNDHRTCPHRVASRRECRSLQAHAQLQGSKKKKIVVKKERDWVQFYFTSLLLVLAAHEAPSLSHPSLQKTSHSQTTLKSGAQSELRHLSALEKCKEELQKKIRERGGEERARGQPAGKCRHQYLFQGG